MAWVEVLAAVLLAGFCCLLVAYHRQAESVAEKKDLERAFLTSIVESSDDAIIGRSPEGIIQTWNPGAQNLYGYTAQEAIGHPITLVIPPDRLGELVSFDRLRQGERIEQVETVRVGKGGRRIEVSVTISPVKDGTGRVVGASTVARDITVRKRAEEAARRANAYNRSLIEASLDPLVTISPDGKITDVNSATEKVTGRSRAELIGTDFSDYFTDPEKAQAGYQQVFREGWVQDYELEIQRRDGQTTPVLYNASVYQDGRGEVVGVFAAARDITERKRTEAALRVSEERYRSLTAASAQIIWTTDPQGLVCGDLPYWRAFTGQTERDIQGWGWANALHPDDRERTAAIWSKAVKARSLYKTEYRIRRKDGEFRDFSVRGVPVLEAGGSIREWIGSCTDITARKQAEEALRRAGAYNRTLIEASLDPLVTINPDGKITDVNSATEKVTGRSRAELIGTDFSNYFTEPDKARAGYQQVFREGSVQDYALEVQHPDGHTIPVLYNASVYRDEGGQVMGVFAAARDITERKRAEEEVRLLNQSLEQRVRERTAELEAANKEMEAFTYSVSHDLRAPLRHVDGFSRLLLDEFGPGLPEGARHYLNRIVQGTRQMGQLVDDLLNLSRVGRTELRLQIAGLGPLVDEVIGELKAENPGRAIEWRVGTLPYVECDPTLMKQVLTNLLSNAVKFTRPREAPVIEVGTKFQDGSETVFVRDNGVGFSMKYADKLFGVFQRLHRPQDFEGTGVGLATVQRIVQKHGGRAWGEGELNQGATFFFTLPGMSSRSGSKVGNAA